ncbi:MAG: hypothetical protein GXY35_04025 [Chlamydiae bacterium]|nr:hypothetical protein [Chlamydiota bacterium]
MAWFFELFVVIVLLSAIAMEVYLLLRYVVVAASLRKILNSSSGENANAARTGN